MSAATPETFLRPSGSLRRRQLVNKIMEGLGTFATFLAIGVLGIVVASVAIRAAPALNWDFFTKEPSIFGEGAVSRAPSSGRSSSGSRPPSPCRSEC